MVMAGYKQTDIGVIPEDWEVKKLGDIGNPSMCKRIMKYQTSDMGQVPFYKIGTFGKKADSYITFELYNEFKNKFSYPKKGDILISASGTIGRIVVFDGIPSYFQDSNIVWIDNNERIVVNEYLTYIYQVIKWSTEDTTIARLYNDNLKAIQIPIPPKQEQKAIAKALSDTDELISSLEKLIAKKQAIKQGTMQQLLTGKKRLSGFSGVWEEKSIKDLVSTPVTDGPHETPKFLEQGIPFLSVNNLVNNKIDLTDLRYISKDYDLVCSRKCKPQKYDILLGKAASVGKVAIVTNNLDFNIWSPIALIRIRQDNLPLFFYYKFQTKYILSQIELLTNSSSQGNIGMGDIEKLKFKFPHDTEEQKAIAKILTDMDNEIESLKTKLAKAKAIKDGMMSELLTGKTRLEVKDE